MAAYPRILPYHEAVMALHSAPKALQAWPVSEKRLPSPSDPPPREALRLNDRGWVTWHSTAFSADERHRTVTLDQLNGYWVVDYFRPREAPKVVGVQVLGEGEGRRIAPGFPLEEVVRDVFEGGDEVVVVVPPWTTASRCASLKNALFSVSTAVDRASLYFADSAKDLVHDDWGRVDKVYISEDQWSRLTEGEQDRLTALAAVRLMRLVHKAPPVKYPLP